MASAFYLVSSLNYSGACNVSLAKSLADPFTLWLPISIHRNICLFFAHRPSDSIHAPRP